MDILTMTMTKYKAVWISLFILTPIALIILLRNPERSAPVVPAENKAAEQPRLQSSEPPAKMNVTVAYTQKRDQLIRSLEAQPSNIVYLTALARLLMDGHRYGEAIRYFERGIALQPANDSLLLDISVCYFNERRFDKAMAATEMVLSRTPNHVRALYNKGAILATVMNTAEALRTWKQLIAAHPESEEAQQARGHVAQLEQR